MVKFGRNILWRHHRLWAIIFRGWNQFIEIWFGSSVRAPHLMHLCAIINSFGWISFRLVFTAFKRLNSKCENFKSTVFMIQRFTEFASTVSFMITILPILVETFLRSIITVTFVGDVSRYSGNYGGSSGQYGGSSGQYGGSSGQYGQSSGQYGGSSGFGGGYGGDRDRDTNTYVRSETRTYGGQPDNYRSTGGAYSGGSAYDSGRNFSSSNDRDNRSSSYTTSNRW